MALFLGPQDAHNVLRRYPRANGLLEELRQGTIERECMEEICSYEEVKEVYESKEKTMEFWRSYMSSLYSVRDPSQWPQRTDSVFVVLPLLGLAFLIIIVLFVIWRCQLHKIAGHPPSYTSQNCYLQNRSTRSIPRVIIYRETAPTLHQQEPPNSRTTTYSEGIALPPQHPLPRLSTCAPPPSYEEVTGAQGEEERSGVHYCDPPPKYEEIVEGL
ncbi:hypothetical protein XENTR_v10020703 [Xenopus tropicalis]|uniref:Proline-rich Gla (G-carboxyglutamic acid) 3 (transmembrane) n=1 Tax=Xenopus tropicalis TaxID=8364 RepID=F7AMN1_XENTR|nr:transmembrane gamma-carboxyglutamic acid protein 3 [Xenopus tropicalis]KAE8583828.1 hypothetical protein XENTR_v10020703 [Xenopus tropicalis]|eukprot:XP_004916823.1 PREDICTED: transmembrane gamma-carboxyglutamic acid protein 3 [Xenopus tropicalis]